MAWMVSKKEKIMPVNEVLEFREKQKKFLKWLPYMTKKRNETTDLAGAVWQDIVKRFTEKVEEPMDTAWNILTDDEKRIFMPRSKNDKQIVFENCPF